MPLVNCRQCDREFNAVGAQRICSDECREARKRDFHAAELERRKRQRSSNAWSPDSEIECPKTEYKDHLRARGVVHPQVQKVVIEGLQEFCDSHTPKLTLNRYMVRHGLQVWKFALVKQTYEDAGYKWVPFTD